MSDYYQERMEADLHQIRSKLRKVSDLVEVQIELAVRALLEDDRDLAARVVLGDRQVNRRIQQIDARCHAFIVRHAPNEAFLRRISAVLRLDVALERVGDYADSIGREVARLSGPPPDGVVDALRRLAEDARGSLAEALRAYHGGDVDLARRTFGRADRGQFAFEEIAGALFTAAEEGERPLPDVFGFLHVINLLMRVLEQSENIREQALFAYSGETLPARVFRVLFVDERHGRASRLSEAYASARYPHSGSFASAGLKPDPVADPELARVLAQKGLAAPSRPATAAASAGTSGGESGGHYNVIVLLGSGGADLPPLPFRTTLVRWDVAESVGAAPDLESLYADVTGRVDDLMLVLAGPDAG